MAKCAVCGMDIQKNPCIDESGKCNVCGKKLQAEEQTKK